MATKKVQYMAKVDMIDDAIEEYKQSLKKEILAKKRQLQIITGSNKYDTIYDQIIDLLQ